MLGKGFALMLISKHQQIRIGIGVGVARTLCCSGEMLRAQVKISPFRRIDSEEEARYRRLARR